MGQKMVRFAQLGAARSRQDKSIEVGEVGSKRPSSGGNGGHVLSLYPLIWRSLAMMAMEGPVAGFGGDLSAEEQAYQQAKQQHSS